MHCFQITKDHPAYESFLRVHDRKIAWRKAKKKFRRALGFSDGIRTLDQCLMVRSIPEHVKDQFSNLTIKGFFVAKPDSWANQQFLKIVHNCNLYAAEAADIARSLGTIDQAAWEQYWTFNGSYYVQTMRSIPEKRGLVAISEQKLHELRIMYLDRLQGMEIT